MSRIRFSIALGIVSLLMALGLAVPAQAAAVCKPLDNPAACTPAFTANQQLAIKSGVPFVWLRNSASSSAVVNATVNYSPNARFVIEYWPSVYDGYQNWWLVHLASDKSKAGMVEQSSLVDGGVPTGTKAPWKVSFMGGARAGLPFVWLRTDPFSSAKVVATIRPGDTFTVSVEMPPVHDGTQWWWYVSTRTVAGYVEQNSIVPVRSVPATSVPPTVSPIVLPTTPPNAPPHANWPMGLKGDVKPGVPFISVRTAPNSTAPVLFNLIHLDPFVVLTEPAPVYDGYQWWWTVTAPLSTYPRSGWVEEASLVERVDDFPTATIDPNVAQPACGTMTVSPITSYQTPDNSASAGIYIVKPGATITFGVEGLANLASITFNVPGPNDTLWRTSTSPRKLDFPGVKAEVTAVVPQKYGWAYVSAEAVGLNGKTIQCGAFWVDNGDGTTQVIGQGGDANVPAATPELSN